MKLHANNSQIQCFRIHQIEENTGFRPLIAELYTCKKMRNPAQRATSDHKKQTYWRYLCVIEHILEGIKKAAKAALIKTEERD